jgi:hypothetical protein
MISFSPIDIPLKMRRIKRMGGVKRCFEFLADPVHESSRMREPLGHDAAI